MDQGSRTADLRRDIGELGARWGQLLERPRGPKFLRHVEDVRRAAKAARAGKAGSAAKLAKILDREPEPALLAKAFCEFLRLSNTAEQVQRVRLLRENLVRPENRLNGVFAALTKKGGRAKVRRALLDLKIDLVLTAHPTEAMPPLSRKACEILANGLIDRDESAIDRALELLWAGTSVRQKAPTPEEEARSGFGVVEQSLWRALPRALREAERDFGESLPHDWNPFQFSSWMGGDRDGNPLVTARITHRVRREAAARARILIGRDLEKLRELLAFDPAYDIALREAPAESLLPKLLSVAADLENKKLPHLARGLLTDLIRCLKAFGPELLRLDLRQSSDVHELVIGQILRARGIDYATLPESEKQKILRSKPPAISEKLGAAARESLALMREIDAAGAGGFNCYIVSMTEAPSDLLEVSWLQRWAGVREPLVVVPLFETPGALAGAPRILEDYWGALDKASRPAEQVVMIGYSDSTKREGLLAASWQLHRVQLQLMDVAKRLKFSISFFHGRGGSIGRGGGPVREALRALPPGSVSPRVRITEQGESIESNYGWQEIATRTLELYLMGGTEALVDPPKASPAGWRGLMNQMEEDSRAAFRHVVYDDPGFIKYFHLVTPVDMVGQLRIGSRPSQRNKKKAADFESLRAIPWIFSWTQNRALMASWLGAGEGLGRAIAEGKLRELRRMEREWPYFRSFLRLLEMVLSKADMRTFGFYDEALATDEFRDRSQIIRASHARAVSAVREILARSSLLGDQPELARAIEVRTPYVDVLNLLQVRLLQKVRAGAGPAWIEALAQTMSGIAAGMRNTG